MARKLAAALAVLACLALLAAASAAAGGNAGFGPPEPASESARSINNVYWIIFGIAIGIFVAVEGALFWFVFRYRRRRGASYEAEGPQVHGNTRLEILWTIVPVLILVAIAVVTFAAVPSVNAKPDDGEEALAVRVVAHQFYWQYEYPNGAISLDVLTLPVDRTVRLELTATDVAHSWWVPELTGKRDAIPGRTNVLYFKPDRLGDFRGQCAEFCGIQHTVMTTKVQVLEQAEFDAWVEREAAAQAAAQSDLGKRAFDTVCAKCHGPQGEGDIGPVIQGKVQDRGGLVTLLIEGQDTPSLDGYMPPVGIGWPDHEVDALLEYMTTDPVLSGTGGG